MKAYDVKDIGVEWIGKIPSHWGVTKLKYSSQVLPSNVDKHIFPDEIQVRLCNYTDVYYNEKIDDSLQLKEGSCTESEFKKFLLTKGDVIVTKDSESPDDIGIPTLVNSDFEDVVCGYHLTLFRPYRVHGGYLFRFIQSTGTRRYFEVNSNGITRFSLGKSTLEDLIHPTPPIHEQEQIVEYLDRKTTLIDSLIEKTVRKIELLKEKRTSLINEVVTKGLNPDVEMKDSGVEWIGEIPSHWTSRKLRAVVNPLRPITYGIVQAGEKLQQGVPYIRPVDMDDGYIPDCDALPKTSIEIASKYVRSELIEGDLVCSIGPSFGKLGFARSVHVGANLTQGTARVSAGKKVQPGFLFHVLGSSGVNQFWGSVATGATFPALNLKPLGETPVPVPPLHEQEQIVEYLDEQTSIIDSTITTEEKRIELLKEYRQSLISEVVTGKVKVTRDE